MNKDSDLTRNFSATYYTGINRTEPYIIEVSSASINFPGKNVEHPTYKCCSACYSVIDKPWDHHDWCQLYEEEALSKWINKGKNEK